MSNILKTPYSIIKDTFISFSEDDCLTHSASIAYYTIFSLPAIMIIIIRIASIFYGAQAVRGQLFQQIKDVVGVDTAKTIEGIVENAARSSTGFILTMVGIGILVFSATTVFVSIQAALNVIWGVKPKPKNEFVKYILNRLRSFALVALLGLLMLISLLSESVLLIIGNFLERYLSDYTFYLMLLINLGLSLIVITVVFALLFKVLPDVRIRWDQVWKGAFVTTILFTIGKYLIGLYLGKSDLNTTYGAAGSLVILLVWVYYSTVILLLGAEFTKVYSLYRGIKIRPTSFSVKVEMKEIENPQS